MASKDDMKDFNRLVSMANKRLRRLEKKGYKSPAYKSVMKSGGKFHNRRGASFNEKQKEYHRVKQFLGMKTSTIKGSKKVINDMLKTTGLDDVTDADTIMTTEIKGNSDGSTDVINKFFDLASMVDDYLKSVRRTVSSDEIWRSIHDTYLANYDESNFNDQDASQMVGQIVDKLHAQYLQRTGKSGRQRNYNTFLE